VSGVAARLFRHDKNLQTNKKSGPCGPLSKSFINVQIEYTTLCPIMQGFLPSFCEKAGAKRGNLRATTQKNRRLAACKLRGAGGYT
jgi:hypothetical protein